MDLVGLTLGHYRVEARLGGGGMGEVFLAEDRRLSRKVALKVLPDKLARAAEPRARFEREARTIAALNHPNIVTIHSVEEASGVVFLTMELVEGQTLAGLIPAGGLAVERILELARPLTEAVAAAHRAGITHRDLKPENVMVDSRGRVKVVDFGLAKLDQSALRGGDPDAPTLQVQSEQGVVVGTVSYMSPEQAEGRAVDARSDVFSLGVLLYQMATGKLPFEGGSAVGVLSSILRDEAPSISSVRPALPRALSRVVSRCLAKDPALRYPSAAELHDDLRRVDPHGAPVCRLSRLPRAARAGLVVLALGAAAAAVLVLRPRPPAAPGGAAPRASRPSVAVLPLANLSPDPENAYFSDGISEEITSKLSRMSGLVVAPPSAAARYRGQAVDARKVGRALGVDYLLEGSVRKADRRVRVSARLVSTQTGFQLWAEELDGELDDVFRVQEEMALRIAEALDLRLSPGEQQAVRRRYTKNPQAYDAYLRGRALVEYFMDPAKLETARTHLEQALELDPDYPLALVGLSRVEAQYHRNLDPSPQRLAKAERLAQRALELEPRLAEAHVALGQVLGNRYEYAQAAERFRQAIQLEPENPYAWDLLSWALAYRQPPDLQGAEEAARRAIGLQASLIGAHYHLGRALLLQGRFDEAIAAFEQSKSLDANFESADFGIAQVHLTRGDYRAAREAMKRVTRGRDSPVIMVQEVFIRAGLGETDAALALLDRVLAAGYRDGAALRSSPHLAALRSHPRYGALLRKHGLTP